MDKKTKEALRRYKKNKAREESSSDSSTSSESDTGTSSSYSSTDSDECKSNAFRRHRKKKTPRSEEDRTIKRGKREHCQKKLEAKRDHIKRKLKEAKLKKRAAAAAAVLSGHSHRSSLSPSTQAKLKKLAERKHLREVGKESRERDKHRSGRGDHQRRELRHSHSPSKIVKLRLHQDILKQQQKKSPQHMHPLLSREKLIIQAHAHDRTPSMERSLRHTELKLCHVDRRDRERERDERESAREKERAEALARCQERQRERERIAREKIRREEGEQNKYGDCSDRHLTAKDREMIYASSGNRGYNSRERSLEALERARYSTKRELDIYERDRNYLDGERHGVHERSSDNIRQDRETLASRRRETSPDQYAMRPRDVRESFPSEDQERIYGRPFQSNDSVIPTHHSREGGNWLEARNIAEQDLLSDGRDYRKRDMNFIYGGESERPIRERKVINANRSSEQWKSNWNASREKNDWSERPLINSTITALPSPTTRKIDGSGAFKRTCGEMVGTTMAAKVRDPMRPSVESDWDIDNHKKTMSRTIENNASIIKIGGTWWDPRRDHEKTKINNSNASCLLGTEPCEQQNSNQYWQNDWHSDVMSTNSESNKLHPSDSMHGVRTVRERPGPMNVYRAQHPQPLMNVSVQPPQQPLRMFHCGSPRLMNKRNMTYTNPNLLKKQQQTALAAMKATAQASAVAAATNVVAAAKAAAQSSANSTTNPGILSQVVRQQHSQTQLMENKPETGEIINNITQTIEIKNNSLVELEKVNGQLSEISDSDDEILNNVEKPPLAVDVLSSNMETLKDLQSDVIIKNTKYNNEISTSNNEIRESADEDDLLHFEEISDGELEEDARQKSLGDALGVDWASLVSETREHATENNFSNYSDNMKSKQRCQSHSIFVNLGVSFPMAGQQFAIHLLKESTTKKNVKINDDKKSLVQVKIEEAQNSMAKAKDVKELNSTGELHIYAFAQRNMQRRLNTRKQMFANICGPFSKALSARKDLHIRRQLCNFPFDAECTNNKSIHFVSSAIKNMALNAFQCALQVK